MVVLAVEDHGTVLGEFGEREPGDAVLLVGRGALALGDVGLEVEPPGRYGSTVHTPYETSSVQGLQVTADGLRGDLELLGE